MKTVAVPAIVSGIAGALSLVFFSIFSGVFGDKLLASILIIQGGTAIVAVMCIPRSWVYLLGATDLESLDRRFSSSLVFEISGSLLGALITALMSTLLYSNNNDLIPILTVYFSLVVPSMGSILGRLRTTESWVQYTAWSLTPSLVRVVLVIAFAQVPGLPVQQFENHPSAIIAALFLGPELLRLFLIGLPLIFRYFRMPSLEELPAAISGIRRVWLFDIGSTITDGADRLIVGLTADSGTLVSFFFARRVASVLTMITEPIYAERYRKIIANGNTTIMGRAYAEGLGLALAFSFLIGFIAALSSAFPAAEAVLPRALAEHRLFFLQILVADSVLAANRWSRYVAQIRDETGQLLAVRTSLFCLFGVLSVALAPSYGRAGLVLAFSTWPLLESCYVLRAIRLSRAPAGQKFSS